MVEVLLFQFYAYGYKGTCNFSNFASSTPPTMWYTTKRHTISIQRLTTRYVSFFSSHILGAKEGGYH